MYLYNRKITMKLKYSLIIFILSYGSIQNSLAESLFKQYKMPALDRITNSSPIKELIYKSKVLKRSKTVSISLDAINDPKTYQAQLRIEIKDSLPNLATEKTVKFTGNKTSELNHFLQSITDNKTIILQNSQIIGDETLFIPENTVLLGSNTILLSSVSPSISISADNITIKDLIIRATGIGVQITNAVGVIIQNLQLTDSGRGIAVLTDSHFIEMDQIQIKNPKQGGILIQGNVSHVWLHNSQISNGQRADHGGAGILISDAKPKSNLEESTVTKSITEHIWPLTKSIPYALLIEHNIVTDNLAQGIYIDGGYGLVIQNNQLQNNDKEGLSLEFGSVNNIVMENTLFHNGFRIRQTDRDLKDDLTLSFGRLADGSAVSKLPGISVDNAAQNLILWNIINNNAGDGIKMVRSGIRNIAMFNSIISNNEGHNKYFHYFGIVLGSAGIESKLDPNNTTIDFLPAIENIIAGNMIYGKHWAGIFLDRGASFNDIYDNMIRHYRLSPLDSTSSNFNSIVGNSWQNSSSSSWLDRIFN